MVKFLYNDDFSCFSRKTVKGTNGTDAITPQKLEVLKAMFAERIDGMKSIDEYNKMKRKKRFGDVLSKIIGKIRATQIKKPCEKQK